MHVQGPKFECEQGREEKQNNGKKKKKEKGTGRDARPSAIHVVDGISTERRERRSKDATVGRFSNRQFVIRRGTDEQDEKKRGNS